MAFKIITDSASDTPQWIVDKYSLHMIPTPVVINGEDHFDRKDIFPEQFYDILESGADVKTYHINAHMFYENFLPYAEAGDEVLYMCFSTGIAGTFGAANMAKTDILEKYPDFQLTIIDTKCGSVGYGMVVYRLLEMQQRGAPTELIYEAAQYYCDHMEQVFTVETLEYLLRGGRISKSSATIGSLLGIKPIIVINEAGVLTAIEKKRGRKSSLDRLVEIVGEIGFDLANQTICVVHAACLEEAESVKRTLEAKYGSKNVIIGQLGCAIGAHTGPGALGIMFLNANDEKYSQYCF